MPFAYYYRLSRARQHTYRKSDEIVALPLPDAAGLHPLVTELAATLKCEDRARVESLCQKLALSITGRLRVGAVKVEVLAVRPHSDHGELHGLYAASPLRRVPNIVLWMRTARQQRVVAFRTFLRTLAHELCHHLDFELLGLHESFHTVGFYQRESSLFRQLVPAQAGADAGRGG